VHLCVGCSLAGGRSAAGKSEFGLYGVVGGMTVIVLLLLQ
jgi:hypothetical protein